MKYLCVIFLAFSVVFCKAQQNKGNELSHAINGIPDTNRALNLYSQYNNPVPPKGDDSLLRANRGVNANNGSVTGSNTAFKLTGSEKNPEYPGIAEKAGMLITSVISINASLHYYLENIRVKPGNLLGITRKKNDSFIYVTDTDSGYAEKFNLFVDTSSAFEVAETNASRFDNYEAFVVSKLMENFVRGEGPEYYIFPTNGIISSEFLKSDILKDAMNDFRIGKTVEKKQYTYNLIDLAKNVLRFGTFNNINGLVGSGNITIRKVNNGVLIKIFNITSLTSGTFGKEIFKNNVWPKSYIRNHTNKTPYGNISQTFGLFVTDDMVPVYFGN
jgi:hypothetical protein